MIIQRRFSGLKDGDGAVSLQALETRVGDGWGLEVMMVENPWRLDMGVEPKVGVVKTPQIIH